MDGWTDGWINRISPNSTGLCLITLREFTTSNLQGKGTADLIMTMCNWFLAQFEDFIYFSCSRFLELNWEESFKIDRKICVAVDKEVNVDFTFVRLAFLSFFFSQFFMI